MLWPIGWIFWSPASFLLAWFHCLSYLNVSVWWSLIACPEGHGATRWCQVSYYWRWCRFGSVCQMWMGCEIWYLWRRTVHNIPFIWVPQRCTRFEAALLVAEDGEWYYWLCCMVLNCQQGKYEHQKLGGLLHRLDIPEWKWKRITMYFVFWLPQTLRKFGSTTWARLAIAIWCRSFTSLQRALTLLIAVTLN